ncbi:MAG: tetratricopeptide repeat protein [Deltaproteobacteria bacterium]|nr:tetratricopeptide repeat protein [Deltaproteobacteria bacterium]
MGASVATPARTRLVRIATLLAALAVNAPLSGAGPVYDDHALVERNALAHAPIQWHSIFTTGYWAGTGIRQGNEYRPLTVLSFAAIDPLGVPAQRLANGLLHGAVAVLVGELAASLLGLEAARLVAGLVFALHPVHADVLGTLVGRGELLAAALGLAAWRAHLTARPRLAAGAVCAAFLAKESAVVIPALMLLGDLSSGDGRPRVRAWLEVMLGLVLAMAIRLAVMGGLLAVEPIGIGDNPLVGVAPTFRILSALASFGTAARLTIFPVGLMPDRSSTVAVVRAVFTDPRWIPGALVLVAAALTFVAALRGARAARPWALALGVFVLAYLPVSNLLFPVGTALAERLLYVPSIGVCFALAALLERLGARSRVLATAALAGVLATGSIAAVWPYRSELAMWQRMVEVAPANPKARVNLIAAYTSTERFDEAERAARDAIALAPGRAEFHHALALTLSKRGDAAGALAEAGEAARLAPRDHGMLLTFAGLLYDVGRASEAEPVYRAVASAFPDDGEPWWYLSRIAEKRGDRAAALAAMREAAARYARDAEWGAQARREVARLGG